MTKKKIGKWTQVEYSKMRSLMTQGDTKFAGVRGQPFWKWISKQMGRTAEACRSKDVHMQSVVNGTARSKNSHKDAMTTEQLSMDELLDWMKKATEEMDLLEARVISIEYRLEDMRQALSR